MARSYLALGSNIGSSIDNIRRAVVMIGGDDRCEIIRRSSFYLTKPVGVEDQPDFVNAVVEIETSRQPRELLSLCKDIEQKVGRTRTFRWGPRVIDIDVLLYDSVTINEEDFMLPHPRMMERAFVLVPLAEIAQDVKLPGGVTAGEAVRRVSRDGVQIMQDVGWED